MQTYMSTVCEAIHDSTDIWAVSPAQKINGPIRVMNVYYIGGLKIRSSW